jgi:hypothetical protein
VRTPIPSANFFFGDDLDRMDPRRFRAAPGNCPNRIFADAGKAHLTKKKRCSAA